jgi:hypothetical protein
MSPASAEFYIARRHLTFSTMAQSSRFPVFASEEEPLDLLSLVAQLSLEDVDDIQSHSKGKGRGDAPLSDEEIAMRLYHEEAAALMQITRDFAFARSLDEAIDLDHNTVIQLAQAEEVAREDREMALALSEGREPPPRSPFTSLTKAIPRTSTAINRMSSTSSCVVFRSVATLLCCQV